MASSWFFILLLKCIDFLSWPVLAFGYPLCASIEAIESDSHSETRNLISYWILLSLIYLFEYAFLRLLQWFQYWHYMKLMMVAFLVTPDFGRAAYVYNQLIKSCIYMNPQAVISRFRSWKNIFAKTEDFIMQAEKYITQNGIEALEKLIASKKNTAPNLDSETRKAAPTVEKNEAQQTNKVGLPWEQKDIKDLEMIEKEIVPDGKPANTALCSLKPNENTLSNIANTEGMVAKYTEGGASPHISACKSFQKEWTCAICQVTTASEADLNFHLHGRSHKAACEALKAKNLSVAVEVFVKKKNDKSGGGESEQKITTSHPKTEQKKVEIVNGQKYYYRPKGTTDQENMSKSVHVIPKVQELQKNWATSRLEMNNSRFRCDVCNVNCCSEVDMASHLKGRRHLAQVVANSG